MRLPPPFPPEQRRQPFLVRWHGQANPVLSEGDGEVGIVGSAFQNHGPLASGNFDPIKHFYRAARRPFLRPAPKHTRTDTISAHAPGSGMVAAPLSVKLNVSPAAPSAAP